jgi:hypothetical protein
MRRVVEHARAPDDVVAADLGDRRRRVHVALHEAHARAAPRELGGEALRRAHDVDAGDRRRAGVLGREAERAVDVPHAADVDERTPRDVLCDQRLARRRRRAQACAQARRGGEGATEHVRTAGGYSGPPATVGAVGSAA